MNAAVIRMLDHFAYAHLPAHLQVVSKACGETAINVATRLESDDAAVNEEVAAGLRKLLEAKDCFVRAAMRLGAVRLPVQERDDDGEESASGV